MDSRLRGNDRLYIQTRKSQICNFMNQIHDILNFWFEGITDETPIDKNGNPFKKWFAKDTKFDAEIHARFADDLVRAQNGHYRSWDKTSDGRLALVILFDQFSRNLHRGTPKMFENDPYALNLSLRSIKEGMDKQLFLIYRIFLYMPLMHSEEREDQEISLKYFAGLINESKQKKSSNASYYEYTLGYAKQHHAIIERFGRFPHRNAILGRVSTPEEVVFLTGAKATGLPVDLAAVLARGFMPRASGDPKGRPLTQPGSAF